MSGHDVFVSFQTAPEQPLIPQTFLAGPCAVRLCAGRWASLQAEEDRRVSEHQASRARKTRGGRPPDIGGQWGPLGDRKGRELGRGRGLQTLLLILSFEKQRGRLLKQNENEHLEQVLNARINVIAVEKSSRIVFYVFLSSSGVGGPASTAAYSRDCQLQLGNQHIFFLSRRNNTRVRMCTFKVKVTGRRSTQRSPEVLTFSGLLTL